MNTDNRWMTTVLGGKAASFDYDFFGIDAPSPDEAIEVMINAYAVKQLGDRGVAFKNVRTVQDRNSLGGFIVMAELSDGTAFKLTLPRDQVEMELEISGPGRLGDYVARGIDRALASRPVSMRATPWTVEKVNYGVAGNAANYGSRIPPAPAPKPKRPGHSEMTRDLDIE